MITSEIGLLDKITKYILRQKGKQIRPVLVLLSAKMFGPIQESTYRAASLVELLHTSTLIHDDVVDTADMRRGIPAINALWKNKVAVLVGDYLLARGLLLSLDYKEYEYLHILSEAVKRMSEGELLQIEKTRFLDIDEETYFRIISDKTASLISTACKLGASSATTDQDSIQHLYDYGEALGIAFQIQDDILDYQGEKTGKPIGGDIKEKKITLPLIHALEKTTEDKRSHIISILRSDKKRALFSNEVIAFVRQEGGIDYAIDVARDYANKAYESLNGFENSESKASLEKLVSFVIERKK
jgi:octaprenyl-diphosphate synthase